MSNDDKEDDIIVRVHDDGDLVGYHDDWGMKLRLDSRLESELRILGENKGLDEQNEVMVIPFIYIFLIVSNIWWFNNFIGMR